MMKSGSCSEEAGLEFDGGRGLYSGRGLPGRSLGPAASLISPNGRLQAGLELRCRPDHGLEGSGVEWPDPHQVLESEVVQRLGDWRRRGDGVFVQEIRDEGRDKEGEELDTWTTTNKETQGRLRKAHKLTQNPKTKLKRKKI